MFTFRFIFSKKGDMRYISHLDLMRLFSRALRRARLPIKMTEGFTPHPKLSLKRALKLGVESEHEEGLVVCESFVKAEEFRDKLQEQLPLGVFIKEVSLITCQKKS